jgi:hypothetical protein
MPHSRGRKPQSAFQQKSDNSRRFDLSDAGKEGDMSAAKVLEDVPKISARASMPRTWAGTVVKATERATHYLHLSAVSCEKCKGPVLSGWIGRRADDITSESEISKVPGICLSCGVRPEVETSRISVAVTHIRPFQWEWITEHILPAKEPETDLLSSELAQDADTDSNSSTREKAAL